MGIRGSLLNDRTDPHIADLEHLAVPIPELDGSEETALLRTKWFPFILHDRRIFNVIVLFSASHYAMRSADPTAFARDILWLKQRALFTLNQALCSTTVFVEDTVIAATAKMASYEAIFGAESEYHTHMDGLERMLDLRGGLSALGLDGFLARLLLFIDNNSAFLLKTRLRLSEFSFPRRLPFAPPNPSKFLGAH